MPPRTNQSPGPRLESCGLTMAHATKHQEVSAKRSQTRSYTAIANATPVGVRLRVATK